MGDLWQQMVQTVVTDEAEQPERLKRQTGKEAADAEAAKKAVEDLLLDKQLSLLAKLQRSVSKRCSSRSNQESCSALEAAQKAEEKVYMHCCSLQEYLILVRRMQLLQQLASQRLPLGKSACSG